MQSGCPGPRVLAGTCSTRDGAEQGPARKVIYFQTGFLGGKHGRENLLFLSLPVLASAQGCVRMCCEVEAAVLSPPVVKQGGKAAQPEHSQQGQTRTTPTVLVHTGLWHIPAFRDENRHLRNTAALPATQQVFTTLNTYIGSGCSAHLEQTWLVLLYLSSLPGHSSSAQKATKVPACSGARAQLTCKWQPHPTISGEQVLQSWILVSLGYVAKTKHPCRKLPNASSPLH